MQNQRTEVDPFSGSRVALEVCQSLLDNRFDRATLSLDPAQQDRRLGKWELQFIPINRHLLRVACRLARVRASRLCQLGPFWLGLPTMFR